MWRRLRWIAILLTVTIQIQPFAYAENTRSKPFSGRSDIRVSSVSPDLYAHSLMLATRNGTQLPYPSIRYMPAADGRSIMTVDFVGAVLEGDAKQIDFPGSDIRQVRVGQQQSYPPILRVSLTSSSTEAFSRVDFRTAPGAMTIQLPTPYGSPTASGAPAPSSPWGATTDSASRREVAQAPILAPSTTPMTAPMVTRSVIKNSGSDALYLPYEEKSTEPVVEKKSFATAPARRLTETAVERRSVEQQTVEKRTVEKRTVAPIVVKQTMAPQAPLRKDEKQPPIAPQVAQSFDDDSDKRAPRPAPQREGKFKRFFKKIFSGNDTHEQEDEPTEPVVTAPPHPAPDATRLSSQRPAPRVVPVIVPAKALAGRYEAAPPAVRSSTIRIANAALKDRFIINVTGSAKFTYKTFRMSNPDRMVVDLAGLNAPQVQVDDVIENSFLRTVRIGNPDQNPLITRIVLDLQTPAIGDTATMQETPTSTALNIVLQRDQRIVEQKPIRSGLTVVLDAGHGGTDPGAQRGDIQEKAMTLDITNKLRSALESKGIHTIMTRSDDTFVSLQDRVTITNSVTPDAFVSIHINALETNTATTGIETYYQNDQSLELARLIHRSLIAGLAAPDRGVRKARFYVINHTPVPAILAEVGFISNKDERDKLTSSDYQQQVATAVADGVVLFLNEKAQNAALGQALTPPSVAPAPGTISTTSPSASPQSFTQNLQSGKPAQATQIARKAVRMSVPPQ